MKKYFFIALLFVSSALFSQIEQWTDECSTVTEPIIKAYGSTFLDSAINYVPWDNLGNTSLNYQPIKTINLSFHIFQRPDGTGNFDLSYKDSLVEMVNWLNLRYSSGSPSDPTGFTELPDYDAKIRFSLGDPDNEHIHFYTDSVLYYGIGAVADSLLTKYSNNCSKGFGVYFTQDYGTLSIDTIKITNPGQGYTSAPTVSFSHPAIIDQPVVYFSNGKIDSIIIEDAKPFTLLPYESLPTLTITGGGGTGAKAQVFYNGANTNGLAGLTCIRMARGYGQIMKRLSNLLAHELGHELGNSHVFENSFCNADPYLQNVFGAAPGNCPHKKNWDCPKGEDPATFPWKFIGDKFTNNIMTYGSDLSYISPRQAGKMHLRTTKWPTISKFVQSTKSNIPLIIDRNIIFIHDYPYLRYYKFFRDVIADNALVEVSDPFLLPKDSYLKVTNDAQLKLVEITGTYKSANGNILDHNETAYSGNIIIENNSSLEINNSVLLNLDDGGELQVKNGCTVVVKNAGELHIDGASIIIETGGTLTIENGGLLKLTGGASITVNGTLNIKGGDINSTSSNFVINGSLNIAEGKEFNFNYPITLNGTINGAANTTLVGIRTYANSSLLSISGLAKIQNITNLTLSTGKIQMQSAAYGLDLINCPNAHIKDVAVTGTTGHQGLELNQCNDALVENSTFTNGFMGFSVKNTQRLNYNGNQNTNNNIGFFSFNSNFEMWANNVSSNANVGIWCNDLTASSYIYESTINGNGAAGPYVLFEYGGPIGGTPYQGGVAVDGYAMGYLYLSNTTLQQNIPQAVELTENYGKLSCVQSIDNDYGVVLKDGVVEGRFAQFIGNYAAFYGTPNSTLGNGLDIYQGFNDLTSNQIGVLGEFYFIGGYGITNPNYLFASSNRWKNPGAPPINGYDYQLTTGGTIIDQSPIANYIPNCGLPIPGLKSAGTTPPTSQEELSREEQLANYMALYRDLMNRDFYYRDASYIQIKQLMSDLGAKIQDTDSIQYLAKKLLKVQKRLFKSDTHTQDMFVNICMDASKTLNILGQYNRAIYVLDSAKSLLPDEKQTRLERAQCKIAAKMDYLTTGNALSEDLAFLGSCNFNTFKSGSVLGTLDDQTTLNQAIELTISPNPVNGIATIGVCLPNAFTNTVIQIVDAAGKVVFQKNISEENTIIQVSDSEFSEGVYLVNAMEHGILLVSKKMVVIK